MLVLITVWIEPKHRDVQDGVGVSMTAKIQGDTGLYGSMYSYRQETLVMDLQNPSLGLGQRRGENVF